MSIRYKGQTIGGNLTTVDSVLSATSTNPIQNQAVFNAIQDADRDVSEMRDAVAGLKTVASTGSYSDLKDKPLHYIVGTGTKAGTWLGSCEEITGYKEGMLILYRLNMAGASTTTLNINGLGAKTVYRNASTAISTNFPVGSILPLVYYNDSWRIADYTVSNTDTIGYSLRRNTGTYLAESAIYRYQLLLQTDERHMMPFNNDNNVTGTTKTIKQTKFNPFGCIGYYSATTTVSANGAIAVGSNWFAYSSITATYSANLSASVNPLTASSAVYIVATPTDDGMAILDSGKTLTCTLPTTEDGKIYIYLGVASSATVTTLDPFHPVFQFKNGKICLYTGSESGANSQEIAAINTAIGNLQTDLAGKQDAITSSNKLDYALISNAPTIPSDTADLTNTAGFVNTAAVTAEITKNGNGIYYIVGNSTNASNWTGTDARITSYYDGLTILYKPNMTGTVSTLNINNLGAKPVNRQGSAVLNSEFSTEDVLLLTYYNDAWHKTDIDTTYVAAKFGIGFTTCYTTSSVTSKAAILTSYTLTAGSTIVVKFMNEFRSGDTLNINNTGASAVWYNGATIKTGTITSGCVCLLCYDGTQYQLLHIFNKVQQRTLSFKVPVIPLNKSCTLLIEFHTTAVGTGTVQYRSTNDTALFKVFNGTTFSDLDVSGLFTPTNNKQCVLFTVPDVITSMYNYVTWYWMDDGGNPGKVGANRLDGQMQLFDESVDVSGFLTSADLTNQLSNYITTSALEEALEEIAPSGKADISTFDNPNRVFSTNDADKLFQYVGDDTAVYQKGRLYLVKHTHSSAGEQVWIPGKAVPTEGTVIQIQNAGSLVNKGILNGYTFTYQGTYASTRNGVTETLPYWKCDQRNDRFFAMTNGHYACFLEHEPTDLIDYELSIAFAQLNGLTSVYPTTETINSFGWLYKSSYSYVDDSNLSVQVLNVNYGSPAVVLSGFNDTTNSYGGTNQAASYGFDGIWAKGGTHSYTYAGTTYTFDYYQKDSFYLMTHYCAIGAITFITDRHPDTFTSEIPQGNVTTSDGYYLGIGATISDIVGAIGENAWYYGYIGRMDSYASNANGAYGSISSGYADGGYYETVTNNSDYYTALPKAMDAVPVIEATNSVMFVSYGGSYKLTVSSTGAKIFVAKAVPGIRATCDIDIAISGDNTVSFDNAITVVDADKFESDTLHHCVLRWYGSKARLYVVDTEDLD